jgi:hypothetical protein
VRSHSTQTHQLKIKVAFIHSAVGFSCAEKGSTVGTRASQKSIPDGRSAPPSRQRETSIGEPPWTSGIRRTPIISMNGSVVRSGPRKPCPSERVRINQSESFATCRPTGSDDRRRSSTTRIELQERAKAKGRPMKSCEISKRRVTCRIELGKGIPTDEITDINLVKTRITSPDHPLWSLCSKGNRKPHEISLFPDR